MSVTTLSTQIFQYREDVANPPVVTAAATTVTNTMVGNIAVTGSPTTTVVGNYQIITFTGSGSFTPTASGNVEMMMIAGGGASTWGFRATPGASSGGLIYYGSNPWEFKSGPALTLTGGTTYTVTIGAGATKQVDSGTTHRPALAAGSNTSISGGSINLIAYGGQGTDYYYSTQANTGYAGAPGAGGSYWNPGYVVSTYYVYFYTGTNPAPNQGYQGGAGYYNSTYPFTTPGGGGAGAPGGSQGPQNDLTPAFGFGGNGFCTDISGTISWYGGGGGGGAGTSGLGIGGTFNTYGGKGGGGNGGANNGGNGTDGATNTGSGGGGAGFYNQTGGGGSYTYGQSGNGGSGVLILKIPLYTIDPAAITAAQTNLVATGNTATGGSVTYSGNYRIHTFTGSGTFTAAHTGFIEYLIIAGGGSGGNGNYNASGGAQANGTGGGGGGGGFLENYESSTQAADFQGARMFVNTGDTVTVVVGGGGAYPTGFSYSSATLGASGYTGRNGSDSLIRNTANKTEIIAYGGGGGGTCDSLSVGNGFYAGWYTGQRGGSGGAAAYSSQNLGSTYIYVGGPGGDCIGSNGGVRQGYFGKTTVNSSTPNTPTAVSTPYYGGGAGADGASGGTGRASTITGASVTYSAGGGQRATVGDTATANSGNGGVHGTASLTLYAGANGGSGIVIIRYRFQ